jgi:DNA repair exonuclease SbcCD ATPase subunit
MYLHFKTLTFRNILSYGNKDSTIHFQEGLNLIVGKNGRGKSTMTDALCFCLYGKPYREIPIPKLVNNKNKKGLRVEVAFAKDGDEYTITRTLKPDSIKIMKNGDEQKLESHKSLIQETIDSILGVNYSLFKQIISLSSLYNKPFIDLDAKEKRDTLESIFNLKAFSIMAKNLKKTANVVKGDLEIKEREIVILKDSTLSLVNQLKDLEQQEENKKIANQAKIDNLKREIEETTRNIDKTYTELNDLQLNDIYIPETDDSEKMKIIAVISTLKSERTNLENKLAKVRNNDLKEFGIDTLIKPLVEAENKELAKYNTETKDLSLQIIEWENEKKLLTEKLNNKSSHLLEEMQSISVKTVKMTDPKCQELSKRNNIISSQITENNQKIKKMEKTEGVCSHCFQVVGEEHKQKEINLLNSKNSELIDELTKNDTELETTARETYHAKYDVLVVAQTELDKNYKIESNSIDEKMTELKKTFAEIQSQFKDFQKQNSESVSKIVEEKKKELLFELLAEIQEKNNHLTLNETNYSLMLAEEKKVKSLREEKERVSRLINESKNRISVLENSLKLKTEQAKEMIEYVPTSFDNLKKDIETKKTYGKKLNEEIKQLREKTKIYEIIKSILDDDGMKRFFFIRLLPKLNQLVNNYLDFFELPIRFAFNDTFEESLTDLSGEEYVFNSFSAGEQFRINLSITLSFIELNKMLNSFNCNIQFFDEIFDSGVDADGMDLVLEKIKDMCDKAKTASYIISHREIDDSMNIDRIIKVEKKEGFSLITT